MTRDHWSHEQRLGALFSSILSKEPSEWINEVRDLKSSGQLSYPQSHQDDRDYYKASDLLVAIELANKLFQLVALTRDLSPGCLPTHEELREFAKAYRNREIDNN